MAHAIVSEAFILSCIKNRVRDEIETAITEEVGNAQKRIEQRMRQMADKLALDLLQHYSVERRGMDIVIIVKKEL